MTLRYIRWSDVLRIIGVDFTPEPPKQLLVGDVVQYVISLLTAQSNDGRRLLRCDDNGCLLVADAWSNLNYQEQTSLYPESGSAKTFNATLPNKGVLLATSTQLVQVQYYRDLSITPDVMYIPPNNLYWFPYPVVRVIIATVPAIGGTASYVGVVTFN